MTTAQEAIERYLAGLPDGLGSFPTYVQKGSVFREFLRGFAASRLLPALPAEVAALITTPPSVNEWIPEVHANVVWVAARAELFPDDDAFEEMAHRQNLRLISSPLYAILFKLVSPERVLRSASSRWAQFHRGIELGTPTFREREATIEMRCPRGLVPSFLAKAYATGFRAALEAAGGRHVRVELVDQAASGFTFRGTWT